MERTKGSKCTFIGNIIQLLWHQNSVLDFMTYHIKNQPTVMIQNIFPCGLCVYIITNPMNVEYILKTNFDHYQKGHFIKTHFLWNYWVKDFQYRWKALEITIRHCKLWICFKITLKLHACYNSSRAKWSTYPFSCKNLQSKSFNWSPKPFHVVCIW